MGIPQFEAKWAFKQGEGQEGNPYPANTMERTEWALSMGECHQEELTQIRKELGDGLKKAK